MVNCNYFITNLLGDKVNCENCRHWNGEKCKVECLTMPYEDTKEFETYDRMMRENKGVSGPL